MVRPRRKYLEVWLLGAAIRRKLERTFLLLFIGSTCLASEARDKAQEAFLIQSGIQSKIDLTQRHFTEESMLYARRTGTEKILGVGLFGYKTYKTKEITFPVGEGKRIYLHTNSVGVKLDI